MNKTEMKEKLRTYILEEIIKKKDYPIDDDEPLISGGLIDSFSLVNIAVFIEKDLGITIPDTELNVESMDSLNKMTEHILKKK